MSKKTQILAALLLLLAALLMLLGTLILSRTSPPLSGSLGGEFTLTTHKGEEFTQKNLKNKPHLLFFGFTHCPDVCPTALSEITSIYQNLGKDAEKLGALFVSVDPLRDTQVLLNTYMSSFSPHIIGLTGQESEIEKIIKAYRVYAKKVPLEKGGYTMDHTSLIFMLDKQGQFISTLNISRKPEEIIRDLRKLF